MVTTHAIKVKTLATVRAIVALLPRPKLIALMGSIMIVTVTLTGLIKIASVAQGVSPVRLTVNFAPTSAIEEEERVNKGQ